ncbi:Sperm-associated antigen 17 [Terramyces sp. JEL0728]|nr:Sperm-associated antigen 17 [Terramyces sp. JEL0728]
MGKGDKKSSNSNLSNLQTLQAQPIIDDNFNAFIYFIFMDAGISSDMNASKYQQLADWISGGYRQRFTALSKSDLVSWGLENVKSYDPCKELKTAMDGGTLESDLSDTLLAKLIKSWLLFSKQDHLDLKNGVKILPRESEAVNTEESKAKAKDKTKEQEKGKPAAAPTGKKGATPSKNGKPAEVPQPLSAGPESGKRKNKLRDRSGGKEKVAAIGDEPANGPDVYFFLKDFDSPGVLISLREEFDVPIDAVFRIEDTPTKKTADLSYVENPNTNQTWLNLNNRAKIQNEPAWRKTVWITIPAVEFKEIKEIFDSLANKIYAILDRKKIFLQFYKADNIINIPTLEATQVDLRYYEYLVSATKSGGKMNIDLQLALFLEYFIRVAPKDENNQLDFAETSIGYLKQLFDSEIGKVVMSVAPDSDRQSADGPKILAVKILDFYDISLLHSYFMSALHSINLDPEKLYQMLSEYFPACQFANFLERNPSYKHLSFDSIAGEFMKIQTEYFKVSKYMLEDTSRMEKFLTQLDLEKVCRNYCNVAVEDFTLDDWRWFGNLGYYSLIQVRTKVDFAKFYDLYDLSTGILDGEVAHPNPETRGTAYLMNDSSMKIIDTNSYLYPDNNVIIKVTKRTSHAINGKFTLISDLYTKIWWNNNFIRFSSGSSARTSANLVARFFDGSAFSIQDNEDHLSIKFSDENGNHFIFQPNGNILCKSYKSEDLAWNKIKVHSRLFFPTGIVVKYYENKDIIVMYPDGTTATQSPGKEWVVPDSATSEEVPQKEAIETEYPNGKTVWTKANFTVVTKYANGSVQTEHADGTQINSETGSSHEIKWMDQVDLKITFKQDGEQAVDMGNGFRISRKYESGKTTSVSITRTAGNMEIKLSSDYFSSPPEKAQNCFSINWRLGTLNFLDLRNHLFVVNADGTTKVTKPEAVPSYPILTFGGRLTKAALKIKGKEVLYGNTPKVFVIFPNRQGGLHLKRDSDMARYFQSYAALNLKTNEESMNHPESVTLSSIREYKLNNSEQAVIQYRHLTRLSQLSKVERENICSEYSGFKEMLKKRHYPVPISELGETEAALQSNYDGTGRFTLGCDKESTQLAIILQYLEKEDLAGNPGLAVNDDVMTLLKQAKEMKTKSTTSVRSNSIKSKTLPKSRKSISTKPPKYFDSPEGQKFLGNQSALHESKNVGVSSESLSYVSEPTSRQSAKHEEGVDRNPESTNGSSELAIPSEPSQMISSVFVASKEPSKVEVPIELPKIKPLPKTPPKVRKLRYPASILGTKPGLIPNVKHLKQEANSHRQLNTASTAESKKRNPIYGVGEFIALPGRCNFGQIISGQTYEKIIELTNVGLDSLRFSVRLPSNELVFVHYKHGSVAPGMSVKLTVSLSAKNEKSTTLEIAEVLKVITEAEILNIPIKASNYLLM